MDKFSKQSAKLFHKTMLQHESREIKKYQSVSVGSVAGDLIILAVVAVLSLRTSIPHEYTVPVFLLIAFYIIAKKFVPYREKYKHDVIRKIFSHLIPGCQYKQTSFVSPDIFIQSRLNYSGDDYLNQYRGDDHVKGKIGNLNIEFSELYVSRKWDDGHVGSIFRGLFFVFELPNSLNQETLIISNDKDNPSYGFLSSSKPPDNYELVSLESQELRKLFTIYSNSQVNARRLLDPSNMEKLIKFKKKYRVNFRLSVRDEFVFFGLLSNKGFFEPSNWEKEIRLKDVEEIFEILSIVHALMDCLEFDEISA